MSGPRGTPRHVSPNQIDWIQEWANEQGLQLKTNKQAKETLIKTLEDSQEHIQILGMLALGQMGIIDALPNLYGFISIDNLNLRQAAYKAIADIQIYLGQSLKNPV